MTVAETTGGLPYVLRETFTTTGRKVNLKINPQWICIRVSTNPCKVYFTQEDFDNDENYVGINAVSDQNPYGEWKSAINSNYIWVRGFNASSDIELVCTTSYIEDDNIDYHSSTGGSPSLLNSAKFYVTTTGIITIPLTGIAGTTLIVDPGDGSSYETVNLTGSNTPWVHDYGGVSGTKAVTFYGSNNIIIFNSNNSISSINLDEFYIFPNCDSLFLTNTPITGDSTKLNNTNFSSMMSLIIRQTGLVFQPSDLAFTSLYSLYSYSNNGYGDISGFSQIQNISYLRAYSNTFTYLNTTVWPSYNGTDIQLQSTLSTAPEVDRLLIDFNDSGLSNCFIKLDGTNPAPTAAAALAIAELTSRGCTVITN